MANISFNSDMVYWRMFLTPNGGVKTEVTSGLSSFVSSITVVDNPENPSKATVSITSPGYMEDFFLRDSKLEIKLGFDKILLPTVFEGVIQNYPTGSARDMLNYTVEALGPQTRMTRIGRTRNFRNTPYKTSIVSIIVKESGFIPIIDIKDKNVIPIRVLPIQRNKPDMEFLKECARRWNCEMWVVLPNFFYFVDEESAAKYGDMQMAAGRSVYDMDPSDYILGYRTDREYCNVETVGWSYQRARGGTETVPGVRQADERGPVSDPRVFEIVWDEVTYRLKPQYAAEARSNPELFFNYSKLASEMGGRAALTQYFDPIPESSGSTRRNVIPPSGRASGFEVIVNLNEGDPYLKPPRNALLHFGSLNPKSATLPQWLCAGMVDIVPLKIFETTLKYDNGMLRSELKCVVKGLKVRRITTPRPRRTAMGRRADR